MVNSVLARLNVYHLPSCWHNWRQEIIIIRYYNWNPWRCGTVEELVLVMGSTVLLPVLVIPIIMLFICPVKLWILFLSAVETLVIVSGGLSGGIFTIYSGLIHFLMNLIQCMGLTGLG